MWNAREISQKNKWLPFSVRKDKAEPTRALNSSLGVGDRLRLVAFAELQARDCFLWGAERYREHAPADWIDAWKRFAEIENKHAQMLLDRMATLNVDPAERLVSDKLTNLCLASTDPVTFLFLLASAEERGMEAGFILGEQMAGVDRESALVFQEIAKEEVEHVEMSRNALKAHKIEDLRERAREVNRIITAE